MPAVYPVAGRLQGAATGPDQVGLHQELSLELQPLQMPCIYCYSGVQHYHHQQVQQTHHLEAVDGKSGQVHARQLVMDGGWGDLKLHGNRRCSGGFNHLQTSRKYSGFMAA